MTKPWQTGLLVFSVDLEGDVSQRDSISGDDRVARHLIDAFSQYSLPATWAVADPAHSAATGIILAGGDHEVAVMGDASWAGSAAGRRRFGQELRRRVNGARDSGVPIASLVLRDVKIDNQLDLLLKNEITAVRAAAHIPAKKIDKPQSQRYGLWQFPVSCSLPSESRWLINGASFACRAIRRAAQHAGFVHIGIDALHLSDRSAIDQVLRVAESARQQGLLSVETMGRMAQRLSAIRQIQPSRSILRPAA